MQYYERLSGEEFERFMGIFSGSSSHAVDLSRAIAASLHLDRLSKILKEGGADVDTARVVDLGSGPGVALGSILKAEGLVREVFADTTTSPSTGSPPDTNGAGGGSPLSVWCVDPFYVKDSSESGPSPAAGGEAAAGGLEHATLPTSVEGCRLQVVGGGRVHFVAADAMEFMKTCRERVGLVDRILMKGMFHHIDVDAYAALGQCLRESLKPGSGTALITTRPASGGIPWFAQAAKLFAENRLDIERIRGEFEKVPGLRVVTSDHVFDIQFSLADWCTCLRGRFFSHLHAISDDDMERGISEVREVHGGNDAAPVAFQDRFLFIQVFRDHDDPVVVDGC